MPRFTCGQRSIGDEAPTYFIADISANHDGDLQRAKSLIRLAADAGADAAKFQSFRASRIVSARGFEALGGQLSHQARWRKPVHEMYKNAELPLAWTSDLVEACDAAGIDFFSTPYDLEAVDMLDPHVAVFKIGSGDITWPEMLRKVAEKGKTVILSTGASEIGEVQRAVREILAVNPKLVLLQCNTNYTGAIENFKHIHLRVLHTYRLLFPEVVVGLSDHCPGHAAVLGAVAMGARVIEKHFTDDPTREGPDHSFSMTPDSWKEMVDRTRELEDALGAPQKKIAENELETVIVQRRCVRAAKELKAGTVITRSSVDVLRPAPLDAIYPYELDRIIGRKARRDIALGEHLRWDLLE